MSDASNQIVSIWKDVEAQLSCHKLYYTKVEIDQKNTQCLLDAYSLWVLATCDSLRSDGLPPSISMPWVHFIAGLDVRDLGFALKDADSVLLRNEAATYEDFKRLLRAKYPFIGRLLSPMKQIMVRWFEQQSVAHFSLIHSWLSFLGRVNVDVPWLEDLGLIEYLAGEKDLQSEGFTDEESDLITSWFPLKDAYRFREEIAPKHGNGSTADAGRHMIDKYLNYMRDARLSYVDADLAPPRIKPEKLNRCCRLVFVPKSITAYRSISMEPASLMWIQQGVLQAFVKALHRHRYLKQRFLPETQEPNRLGAWMGSLDGSFATIDLSSASDSVSWELVKKWFHKTYLYRWMLCTRSTSVLLPTGDTLALKKFAPMGSALCFPTECVVFCAIVECAIKECGADPGKSLYRVYGDDIVVETEFAQAVINRLEKNGFKVNRRKSFTEGTDDFRFRESCGGEYLNGEDVTPVRISRRFSGMRMQRCSASQIEGLVDLANDCYSRYPTVRRRLVHAIMELPAWKRPLFNSTGEGGFFSLQPTNWHLPSPRWSARYQRFYVDHGALRIRREPDSPEYEQVEDIRLFEYLRQSQGRARLLYPEDRIDVDLHRPIAGIWTVVSSPAEGIIPSMEIVKTP